MVMHLLSTGDASLLACGIPCHPTPDKTIYPKITKPTQWHLASHDYMFGDKHIAAMRQAMEGRDLIFDYTVYPSALSISIVQSPAKRVRHSARLRSSPELGRPAQSEGFRGG
jgi:dienelactone hydrolase